MSEKNKLQPKEFFTTDAEVVAWAQNEQITIRFSSEGIFQNRVRLTWQNYNNTFQMVVENSTLLEAANWLRTYFDKINELWPDEE